MEEDQGQIFYWLFLRRSAAGETAPKDISHLVIFLSLYFPDMRGGRMMEEEFFLSLSFSAQTKQEKATSEAPLMRGNHV